MKKYLLPNNANAYKANLHCHTNISDGRMSSEEVKAYYKERGYSIVAYTDHEILIGHNDLTDESFLALNGVELGVNQQISEQRPFKFVKVCHFCVVALDPDNLVNVACSGGKYVVMKSSKALIEKAIYDPTEEDIEREYTPECISRIMKRCRDAGFFVTYNHPCWSLEDYSDYMNYDGYNGMEIINYASYVEGYPDHNEVAYDNMLRAGKRVFAIADDDNHGEETSCGAYNVIFAEKLDYKTVTDALVRGDFYASEGPQIKALWYEDGKIHIETSPVRQIRMNLGIRGARVITAKDELLCEATFPLDPQAGYFRLTIQDEAGLFAHTNAYFLDELQ